MQPITGPIVASEALSQPRDGVDASPSSVTVNKDFNLHLPRILCLHGGGSNSRVFRAQCRIIRAQLQPYFRLVFADAPFLSQPGSDIEPVYAEWGPFRSWLRPRTKLGTGVLSPNTDEIVIKSIDHCIEAAMQEDNKSGAGGKWVGLLGFSQGAKMAASLLLRQQMQNDEDDTQSSHEIQIQTKNISYRFAVLFSGGAPLVSMMPGMVATPANELANSNILLQLPTIHIHGLQDAGISMHRDLLHQCCKEGSTRLIEWDGDHRVPIKTKDVAAVVAEIISIAGKPLV
ncbi:serine hydrolase FSH [Jackrogersella minutella]|nr:serine hydrolase FSH [Jackrogersella minutella]